MATIAFRDCMLLDCTGADPAPRSTVVVEGERIARVVRDGEPGGDDGIAYSPTRSARWRRGSSRT